MTKHQERLSNLLWFVAADPEHVARQSPTPITPAEVKKAQAEARLILLGSGRRREVAA